jgi:hypothetical protein
MWASPAKAKEAELQFWRGALKKPDASGPVGRAPPLRLSAEDLLPGSETFASLRLRRGEGHHSAFPRRVASGFCMASPPKRRVPGAFCTRGLVCK